MVGKSELLPQFSLRSLLGILAILGVGMASATSDSSSWASGLAICFHLVLPVSIVFAIYGTGERRAFWIGVAVVNLWCHLASGKGDYLVGERQKSEVLNFLDTHVAAPIVGLRQVRVEQIATRRVQTEVAAVGPSFKVTQTDLALAKSEFIPRIEAELRENITLSLKWLLLFLASMCGGWLSHRTHQRSSTLE